MILCKKSNRKQRIALLDWRPRYDQEYYPIQRPYYLMGKVIRKESWTRNKKKSEFALTSTWYYYSSKKKNTKLIVYLRRVGLVG